MALSAVPPILACATCQAAGAGGVVTGSYDPLTAVFSIVIAVVASLVALDVGARAGTAAGAVRRVWLVSGAGMMGLGIWTMHFVGMQAYRMSMPVTYEPWRTALSALAAIGASAAALLVMAGARLSRARQLTAGTLIGVGIVSMHYIGISAMRMQATITYRPLPFVASVLVGIGAALGAILIAARLRGTDRSVLDGRKVAAAVLMGVAIAGMHYLGIEAAIIREDLTIPASVTQAGVHVTALGTAGLGLACLGALGLLLVGTAVDSERRESERALRFLADASARLGRHRHRDALLEEVPRLALALLGDGAAVELADGTRRLFSAPALPDELHRALVGRVVEDGDPTLRCRRVTTPWIASFEAHAGVTQGGAWSALLRTTGASSAVFVPIPGSGEDRATLVVWSKRVPHASRLALIEDFRRRVSDALENAAHFRASERAREAAEQATRERDVFLGIATHELRGPVTSFQLEVRRLERLVESGEIERTRLDDSVARLGRQSARMARLVRELLDVTRIASGRLELRPDRVELVALVRDVVEQFSEEIEQAGAPVTVHAEGSCVGTWDHLRVEQVITNLVTNALKYGANRAIDITVRATPEEAVLSVADHGIGIPPEKLGAVFERFERAVDEHHSAGLGLGLYIARQIVHAHGGRIDVRSTPGDGSTFTVTLPRLAAADEPRETPPGPSPSPL